MTPADLPEADGDLVLAVAGRLRELAEAGGAGQEAIRLEWSQAGTHHSGRLTIGAHRPPIPADVTASMAALRTQMARPGSGTWLSAMLTVHGSDISIDLNYHQRPYWNAPATTMLEPPNGPPEPTDARWAADLRRYPRDRDHQVPWLATAAVSGEATIALRSALTQAGFPAGGVALPGEQQTPFEGTVTLLRHSSAHFSMQITDYGQHEFLAEYPHEEQACRAVWDYLHQPLPAPTPMSAGELHQRAQAAAPSYADLHRRLEAAGPGGVVTNLATGVPFDRIGALDGLYFFPWNTPWAQRSLPDSGYGPGAEQIVLMAPAAVEVQAEIVPPWFDQPGGGIRFRVEGTRHEGLRDLVRRGVLIRIQPTG